MYIIEEDRQGRFIPIKIKIRFDDYDRAMSFLRVLKHGDAMCNTEISSNDNGFEEIHEFIEDFRKQISKSYGEEIY